MKLICLLVPDDYEMQVLHQRNALQMQVIEGLPDADLRVRVEHMPQPQLPLVFFASSQSMAQAQAQGSEPPNRERFADPRPHTH